DPLRIEHRHGLAAPALDGARLGLPAAQILRHLAQRAHQIQFLDRAGLADLIGRFGAAERTDELLLAGIPLRLRPAGGARMFLEGGCRRQLYPCYPCYPWPTSRGTRRERTA